MAHPRTSGFNLNTNTYFMEDIMFEHTKCCTTRDQQLDVPESWEDMFDVSQCQETERKTAQADEDRALQKLLCCPSPAVVEKKKDNHRVICDGPELLLETKLEADLFQEWPDILPEGCQTLIEGARKEESIDISKPYEVDSTIEIGPENGDPRKWKVSLRREAVRCYREFGKKTEPSRKNYIHYVERMKKEYKQDISEKFNGHRTDTDIPKIYKCPEEFENSLGKCQFYVCGKPYCVKKTKKYYAAGRPTGVRVITISPRAHHNNEQWVQTKEAWEIVVEVINDIKKKLKFDDLPIEKIYINFGRWQSQAENGLLLPRYCHAHINIMLTLKAIEACRGRIDEFKVLQDSIYAPKDYRRQEATDLSNCIDRENEFMYEWDDENEWMYQSDDDDDDDYYYLGGETTPLDAYCFASSRSSCCYESYSLMKIYRSHQLLIN